MAARKKVAAKTVTAQKGGDTLITNCNFTGHAAAHNEHTVAAITALASACAANANGLAETARAISRAADGLKSAVGLETGVKMEYMP